MANKDLLPCPFCGGKDFEMKINKYNHLTSWYQIKCKSCKCRLHDLDWERAEKAWNRRS